MVLSLIQNIRLGLKYRGGWWGLLEHMYTNGDYPFKFGTYMGCDAAGNRYYENRVDYPYGQHRWVEPADINNFDASHIPPEWHGWMHSINDATPTTEQEYFDKMIPHIERHEHSDAPYNHNIGYQNPYFNFNHMHNQSQVRSRGYGIGNPIVNLPPHAPDSYYVQPGSPYHPAFIRKLEYQGDLDQGKSGGGGGGRPYKNDLWKKRLTTDADREKIRQAQQQVMQEMQAQLENELDPGLAKELLEWEEKFLKEDPGLENELDPDVEKELLEWKHHVEKFLKAKKGEKPMQEMQAMQEKLFEMWRKNPGLENELDPGLKKELLEWEEKSLKEDPGLENELDPDVEKALLERKHHLEKFLTEDPGRENELDPDVEKELLERKHHLFFPGHLFLERFLKVDPDSKKGEKPMQEMQAMQEKLFEMWRKNPGLEKVRDRRPRKMPLKRKKARLEWEEKFLKEDPGLENELDPGLENELDPGLEKEHLKWVKEDPDSKKGEKPL